ncbi:MAG: NADP-dependent phosphogluconate dehydrogenase [Myxococcota bacterium]|jgi:6-phosphogluconate dehydrogenase|nr:NADP-dependent phosphogluconate dehydrogenase [Myxococcota bacterium]
MSESYSQLAVLGMGVMGRNLALNFAEHGFRVSVYNRTQPAIDATIQESGGSIRGTTQFQELVAQLERPRRLILMVTAGAAVDELIELLLPLLDPEDVIVDGGNSWFEDTRRREAALRAHSLHFMGCGISGGEAGARRGPSMMPGGSQHAYQALVPFFEAIAAQTESGACVSHIGPDGAGHFVKMVHNGIEYADMQLIAESYDLLRKLGGMNAGAIAKEAERWKQTMLDSYLVDITAQVLDKRDERGWLVDRILDEASQKGTGRWTVQAAAELGVPIPAIAAAVDARLLSSRRSLRRALGKEDGGTGQVPNRQEADPTLREELSKLVEQSLLAAKVLAYTQGFDLLSSASRRHEWSLELSELARIWKGGCIIRARLLDDIMRAYARDEQLSFLALDPELHAILEAALPALRRVVALGAEYGIALPAMSASLAYLDALSSAQLPHNLIQAQRDAFGAHTFRWRDEPDGPPQHVEWLNG